MQAALCKTAVSLTTLPQLAYYASHKPSAEPAQPGRVSLSCRTIAGQISTEDITAAELAERHGVAQGIAVCIHDAAVTFDKAVLKVRLQG